MTDERITELLNQWSASAADEGGTAFALVYDELRRIAAAYLRREPPGHVLQATGIVHEAFLRLSEQSGFEWRDRNHFFAFSSRIMRRVLVDEARRRKRAKRGGSAVHITLEDAEKLAAEPDVDVLRIDEA
ncbi:MAG: ECF-type sigma factor, partial [Acidobacteriota bacterium]